jgi:hypothetical protein
VRGDRPVPVGAHDDVDVRRPPGVASGQAQQAPDRAVGGNGVRHRPQGADQEPAVGAGAVPPAQVVGGLHPRLLDRVEAAGVVLPQVQHGPADRGAVGVEHSPGQHRRLAGRLVPGDHRVAEGAPGRVGHVERSQDRSLGTAGLLGDHLHQGRQAQRVGEQDELLPGVAARLPGRGEKADRGEPLVAGEVYLAGEGVQMPDERPHHLPQARIGGVREPVDHLGREFGLRHESLLLVGTPGLRPAVRVSRRALREILSGRCRTPPALLVG